MTTITTNQEMPVLLLSFLYLLMHCDSVIADGFKQFDDSILFKMTWQQEAPILGPALKQYYSGNGPASFHDNDAVVLISTGSDEKYLCSLPKAPDGDKPKVDNYLGPAPGDLMAPLYNLRSCTYRIEMYWTYELCHGRFLMQYHEEKDAVKGKTFRTEYYLGQFMSDRTAEEDAAFDQLNPPKRKVDDQLLPYYPVRYAQGTVCDITGKPRLTTVHYVCMLDGKNQIYSLDEVSSCEYEVVVLTNRLCSHPAFEPDVPDEHDITCVPVDGGSIKPTALTEWEKEQQSDFQQQFAAQIPGTVKPPRVTKEQAVDEDDGTEEIEPKRSPPRSHEVPAPKAPSMPPVDQQLASTFLSGEYCLYGGAGWWKHEYCHGKQVLQFHEDAQVGRIEIVLGKWDVDAHLKWIQMHPHKKPIKVDGRIRQVSHLYVKGDVCEASGMHRTVEVRLRCRETQGNQNAVTLYLLEPHVCEYILGVESAMLCDLLQSAGDDGLFDQSNL